MEKPRFAVEFYKTKQGRSPVQEYIERLPNLERSAVEQLIRRHKQEGNLLGSLHTGQIDGKLRELRLPKRKHWIRIFFITNYRTIHYLHIVKKSRNDHKLSVLTKFVTEFM
ncbi:MAG: type II toxin-antitoxin system RelE/ParE family toxin [Candidatus Woesebacteria bacterium]|nr:MAG: type II toxin-antitoxin system RelE/ParE family toxin [Candidatus Woesebacteria bacterium]